MYFVKKEEKIALAKCKHAGKEAVTNRLRKISII